MIKIKKEENNIKIKKEISSLEEFIERPIADEKEVEKFENKINKQVKNREQKEADEEREEIIDLAEKQGRPLSFSEKERLRVLQSEKVFIEIIPTWFILPIVSFLLS